MKDPAMLFYTQDFLTGVSDLTMEERGEYITLLCLHHQKGRLTKKAVALAVAKPSADVLAKFEIDENGLYYNKRLELEADKRAQHSKKQRDRALSGWKKRKAAANAVASATALPLENENENENESKIEKEKEPYLKTQFLEDWNEMRTMILKKPSFVKNLRGVHDSQNLNDIIKVYDRAEIRSALAGLFQQRQFPAGSDTYTSSPSHFLEYFDRYLTAFYDKNKDFYKNQNVNQ